MIKKELSVNNLHFDEERNEKKIGFTPLDDFVRTEYISCTLSIQTLHTQRKFHSYVMKISTWRYSIMYITGYKKDHEGNSSNKHVGSVNEILCKNR